MSGTFLLLDDIRTQLVAYFADTPFREPVDGGQPKTAEGKELYRIPRVYIGDLPPKRKSGANPTAVAKYGEDFPYMLVRAIDGESSGSPTIHQVNVGILCGIYSAEESSEHGTQDILNMLDRVRTLLESREYWADDFWRHVMPVRWYAGLDRRIDMYAAGSQSDAPFYGGVLHAQFEAAASPRDAQRKIVDAY